MTQEELAEAADLSPRYVQSLESGVGVNPSLEVLTALKGALGCTWEELLN